jgi:hypothetical protein
MDRIFVQAQNSEASQLALQKIFQQAAKIKLKFDMQHLQQRYQ